jgi:hypothetical protein
MAYTVCAEASHDALSKTSTERQMLTFDSRFDPAPTKNRLVCLGHAALVARALVFVAADLLVLALPLLHERCELRIVILRHGLRRHLDRAVAACFRYVHLDILDRLLEDLDADVFIETLGRKDCAD